MENSVIKVRRKKLTSFHQGVSCQVSYRNNPKDLQRTLELQYIYHMQEHTQPKRKRCKFSMERKSQIEKPRFSNKEYVYPKDSTNWFIVEKQSIAGEIFL